MRNIAGSLGVLLTLAALTGCSSPKKTASPNDVFAAMNHELSHTIAQGDTLDAMDDELSHAIGTTALTSETLVSVALLETPMPLPETRMSLAEDARPAIQTWGAPVALVDDLAGEIPDSRE